jgi:hypothetical protein
MTATYLRQLEAHMRHDAVCWKAGGGSRLSWILYYLGDCYPMPNARSVQNLNILAGDVWSVGLRPGEDPCS